MRKNILVHRGSNFLPKERKTATRIVLNLVLAITSAYLRRLLAQHDIICALWEEFRYFLICCIVINSICTCSPTYLPSFPLYSFTRIYKFPFPVCKTISAISPCHVTDHPFFNPPTHPFRPFGVCALRPVCLPPPLPLRPPSTGSHFLDRRESFA